MVVYLTRYLIQDIDEKNAAQLDSVLSISGTRQRQRLQLYSCDHTNAHIRTFASQVIYLERVSCCVVRVGWWSVEEDAARCR